MDWTAIVLALIGALTGGAATAIVFYPQIKRTKVIQNEILALDADSKASDGWKELYERENQLVISKDKKIDDLYEQISRHRDEKADLREQLAKAEIENTRLTVLKCNKPGCPHREPPTGY